jgi:anti-sigma28 factor (negative regulator of flagellin synthesis)
MALDQNITYRVNVDDSNFQAKLTQMRASLDSTIGMGGGMMGGGPMMYGMMGMMGGGGAGQAMSLGGLADFGSMVRPVTYTPPAIAMQPHFGMIAVQQSLSQAGLGMFGPGAASVGATMRGFARGGIRGAWNAPNAIPDNISVAEYMNMSNRQFGAAFGDAMAVGGLTVASTAVGLGAGGIGSAAGAALFSSGVGKFVGGLLGGAVLGTVASQYFGEVSDFMAENRAIQTALSAGSFRFMTGGADVDRVTGRGMSLEGRQRTAAYIQDLTMNDLRYGANEYRQILEGGMQMDLFSGTRDVDDFKGKFKGLVENLKTVTSTLHTSLKEGLEVMRGFRDMGVTDPGEVNRLVLSSEMRGRTSGRTGMEMLAIGQTGAELFRGTGITMERGFELNQMNAAAVRSGLNTGLLSRESVAQAGGELALAQQMTANTLASFQTSYGRAAMMANFNPATGQMNPNMVNNLLSGNTLQNIAGATHLGPAGMIAFQARQEELISQMNPQQMQLFGISNRMGLARHLMSAYGVGAEDAYRFTSQREGMSKSQIDADLAMMRQNPEEYKQNQMAAMEAMRVQAGMEDIRSRFSPGRMIGNWFTRNLVAPVGRVFTGISGDIERGVESLGLGLRGVAVGETSGITAGMAAEGEKILESSGEGKGVLLDARGSFYQRNILGQSSEGLLHNIEQGAQRQEDGTYTYRGSKIGVFKTREEAEAAAVKSGRAVSLLGTTTAFGGGEQYVTITDQEAKKAADAARGLQVSSAEAKAVENVKLDIATGSRMMDATNMADAVSAFSGGKFTFGQLRDLSDADFKEKTGLDRGTQKALLSRYVNTFAASGSSLKKEWAAEQDSAAFADASAGASKDALDRAQAAKQELIKKIMSEGGLVPEEKNLRTADGGRMTRGAFQEKLLDDPELIQTLVSGGMTDKEKVATLRSKGIFGAEGIVKNLAETSKSWTTGALSDDIKVLAAQSARARAASGASGAGGPSATVGEVSKETMTQIETMSKQLESSYKTLIALQTQLNGLIKEGRGH